MKYYIKVKNNVEGNFGISKTFEGVMAFVEKSLEENPNTPVSEYTITLMGKPNS